VGDPTLALAKGAFSTLGFLIKGLMYLRLAVFLPPPPEFGVIVVYHPALFVVGFILNSMILVGFSWLTDEDLVAQNGLH
jgi:hypothetical protein